MIWDKFFFTRAALVFFYMVSAIFWLVLLGFEFYWPDTQKELFFLLLLIHSLGMISICAGFFGQHRAALCGTLVIGLTWFAALVILLLNLRLAGPVTVRIPNLMGAVNIIMVIFPSFALFFITWLLVRNSRQVPGHFREF